ncbi:uncharacterized protein K441DRAFT_121892 [Cenococcum geophilum 1.58]|uniref:uncharacterized protein n=1 Tax=Cenococcum geophilum 1.58 TaxID=794803 RepID=UPI00358E0A91|nr:hypothetical protein K441DRAFT_121892 [Cenococcum geophilum 1.58]
MFPPRETFILFQLSPPTNPILQINYPCYYHRNHQTWPLQPLYPLFAPIPIFPATTAGYYRCHRRYPHPLTPSFPYPFFNYQNSPQYPHLSIIPFSNLITHATASAIAAVIVTTITTNLLVRTDNSILEIQLNDQRSRLVKHSIL